MSHMLVYGADELHFLKALALVVWFSKRCISTGEVRSYGFKLAFPDGEGEPLAVDRVDYKQPQAGCMVLGLKSFFFPQGRMVSILPSPKHTKKTALLVGASKGFYSLEKFGIVVIIGYAVFSLLFGSSTAPIQL